MEAISAPGSSGSKMRSWHPGGTYSGMPPRLDAITGNAADRRLVDHEAGDLVDAGRHDQHVDVAEELLLLTALDDPAEVDRRMVFRL